MRVPDTPSRNGWLGTFTIRPPCTRPIVSEQTNDIGLHNIEKIDWTSVIYLQTVTELLIILPEILIIIVVWEFPVH